MEKQNIDMLIIWIFQKHPSIDELKSLWIAPVASGSAPHRKHSVNVAGTGLRVTVEL